jgi:hypothetical protein
MTSSCHFTTPPLASFLLFEVCNKSDETILSMVLKSHDSDNKIDST